MAVSSLTAYEIINISSDYGHLYNLKKEEIDEIKKILIEKGRKEFYIFRYIAKVKNFLLTSENNKFTMQVPTVRERTFMEDLNRKCYIKIIRRKTIQNSLYDNEIYAIVKVFY